MRPDQSSTTAFMRTWRRTAPLPAPPAPLPPTPRVLTAAEVAAQAVQIEALEARIAALEPTPAPVAAVTAVEEIARLQRAAVVMEREHLEGRATLEQVEAIRRATSAKIDLAAREIQKRDGVSYADAVARLTRVTP